MKNIKNLSDRTVTTVSFAIFVIFALVAFVLPTTYQNQTRCEEKGLVYDNSPKIGSNSQDRCISKGIKAINTLTNK